MYPQQQTNGQTQGTQYINFGIPSLILTGGEVEISIGYLCGSLSIYSFYLMNSVYFEYALTNPIKDPIYVNDATVELTIYDRAGDALPSISWPQELTYVTDSNGVYRLTIPPMTDLEENETYTFAITANGEDALVGYCEYTETAEKKSC